ncbi:LIM domain only protein 7 isoform X14 [Oncorhynchus kisutch]|uniref:LIM domain only protein 7 isoform X14 n=1 Tax=Oncorhynchus kisutch TaxID=8019 RepID=UPI0012DC05CB|nr:LIM domain only protein 7-like isoform X14 [Oncorhynchus kisutch]
MEWREQTSVTCEDAFTEAQRWMEEVTNKSFGSNNFRSALENGVLLCHLINQLKPGLIKRVNTLSTPMAGLDNVNVFLRACGTLGLHEAQLFHPGDLQDLSTRATLRCAESKRRLKNVLITIYWLGRKAQADPFYSGPQLNLRAFEGLLGIALSKALEETPRGSVTDRDYSDVIYPERDDELLPLTRSQTPGYSREDSVESFTSALSFDSAESRTLSCISDSILRAGSEDSSSDVEAENSFRMKAAEGRESGLRNWGNVPAPFQRKKHEENRIKGCLPSPLTRNLEVNPGWIWSKSLNDIRRFPSPTQVVRQVSEGGMELSPGAVSQDQLQMVRARVHESEAKWHNDLTKWKLRRHRSNCDLRRKMQERDNIVLMANAGLITVGTFKSLQEDREEDEESLCSNGHKVSPSTSIQAQTISSPALFISTGRDHNVSLLSNGIPTTLPGSSSSLTTGTSSSLTTSDPVNGTGSHSPSASMDIPDHALLSTVESLTSVGAPGYVSAPQQQELPLYRYSSRAPGGRGGASASLPRGYRRSEGSSSCLSAGFTPRPFGAKSSRGSSLPRFYNLEKTASTRPQKMVTISEVAVRAQPWATANRSSVNQEVEEGGSQTQPSILKTRGVPGPATHPKPLPPSLLPSIPVSVRQNGSAQVRHSDRVSLTLKINSRPHFGFNTHWDSTGARVGGIQPGSPAELCQLRAGDEIVSVGGHRVAEMSHNQWKGMMTSALQKGSLTMDVQRYGNNGPTDTSGDATMVKLAQINGQEGVTSKSRKGGFQDDPLTGRSKGGSASAISDLQVPSLSTSPSSWSWDPEEERRRQEKWQEEQERLLQEKYRQDQERLDAEWQQAQDEAGVEGYRQAEVTPDPLPSRCIVGYVVPCVKSSTPNMESSGEMTNGITGLASPQPALSQPMPPVAHVASNQKEVVFDGRREEPHPQEGRDLEEETVAEGDNWSGDSYGFTQLSIADRMKSKSSPSLEGFHRQEVKGQTLLLTVPLVNEWGPQGDRGATREVARRKPPQSMSLVEAERQQILDEMRKRTALLTDNSWIRQRSTSDNKQPTNRRGPMRRYDSLDNLLSSTTLLSNPQRPHSSLGFAAPYRPPSSRHSMSVALGGYSNGTQKHSPTWPRPFSTSSPPPNTGEEPATGESRPVSQQHHRVLTSRQVCSVCVCPMGRGAAMVIETLNLCFHLACFQCVDCRCRLGGSEVRAQIRISNGKPYCDPCYIRLKSHLATSL